MMLLLIVVPRFVWQSICNTTLPAHTLYSGYSNLYLQDISLLIPDHEDKPPTKNVSNHKLSSKPPKYENAYTKIEDDKDEEDDEDDSECKPVKNASASASMMRLKQGKDVLEKHLTTTIKCLMNKDKHEKENTTENKEPEVKIRKPESFDVSDKSAARSVRFSHTCENEEKAENEKKAEMTAGKKAIGITRGESIFQDMPENIYDDMPQDVYQEMPENAHLDVSPDTFKNIPVDVFQDLEDNM
jgi:hypothetical protein